LIMSQCIKPIEKDGFNHSLILCCYLSLTPKSVM
jgi:hypothetical protein